MKFFSAVIIRKNTVTILKFLLNGIKIGID